MFGPQDYENLEPSISWIGIVTQLIDDQKICEVGNRYKNVRRFRCRVEQMKESHKRVTVMCVWFPSFRRSRWMTKVRMKNQRASVIDTQRLVFSKRNPALIHKVTITNPKCFLVLDVQNLCQRPDQIVKCFHARFENLLPSSCLSNIWIWKKWRNDYQ